MNRFKYALAEEARRVKLFRCSICGSENHQPGRGIMAQCRVRWCLPCYEKAGGSEGVIRLSERIEEKVEEFRAKLFLEELTGLTADRPV